MRVRLSAETLRSELVCRIEEISGEDLLKCYQCGRCAAGCPAAFAMDMLPSQVIRFAQLGLVEEVLHSETPWFCAACQTCYAARGLLDIALKKKMVKRLPWVCL